jgi:hypothetical protein
MEKNTAKMTKAVAFALAIKALETTDFPERDEAIAKLAKEIENVSKKNGSGKLTKAQEANAVLANSVAEFMAENSTRLFTISELSKECPAVLGMTTQKIRPLLATLMEQKKVERTEVKGKPVFQFVGEEVED